MSSFNIIQCDACKNEDPTNSGTVESWSAFSYAIESKINGVDIQGIDLCPTCSVKMLDAITAVMHGADPAPDPLESLETVETRHIVRALTALNWNKSLAAKSLGIERSTLDRKLKRHGLARPGAARGQVAAQVSEGVAP